MKLEKLIGIIKELDSHFIRVKEDKVKALSTELKLEILNKVPNYFSSVLVLESLNKRMDYAKTDDIKKQLLSAKIKLLDNLYVIKQTDVPLTLNESNLLGEILS